jgi:hypothetical protein
MKSLCLLSALFAVALPAVAQNPITELAGSTYHEKVIYAVYDLRGANLNVETIESAVLDAVKLYARNARVQQSIPPSPYPATPAHMTIGRRPQGGPMPECAGELFSIDGFDTSMAKYGESTYHRACLFPYQGGYRVNYFAIFGMQSGAGNRNPNVLAAMLGRAMAGAVGLGNSSNFINKTLERMEGNLKEQGVEARLVQLHPKELEGRVVVADDLPPPAVAAAPAQPAAQPVQLASAPQMVPMGSGGLVQQNLPPELARMREEALRNHQASKQPSPKANPQGAEMSASDARKELTAMGLQYYNQDQFVAAIRRGDTLAVDLYLAGGGIDLNAGSAGKTPLAIADNTNQQAIAAMLRKRGAQ